jgi:hypothetical protein
VREYHEERPRFDSSVSEEMWQQQAAESRRRREAATSPVPFVTVSTPMNDQLGKIGRALGASQRPQLPGPKLADVFPAAQPSDRLSAKSNESPAQRTIEELPTTFGQTVRLFYEAMELDREIEEAKKITYEDPFKLALEVFGRKSDSDESEAQR